MNLNFNNYSQVISMLRDFPYITVIGGDWTISCLENVLLVIFFYFFGFIVDILIILPKSKQQFPSGLVSGGCSVVNVHFNMSMLVCIREHAHMWICLCPRVLVCMHVHAYICLCMPACVCMCICVCFVFTGLFINIWEGILKMLF